MSIEERLRRSIDEHVGDPAADDRAWAEIQRRIEEGVGPELKPPHERNQRILAAAVAVFVFGVVAVGLGLAIRHGGPSSTPAASQPPAWLVDKALQMARTSGDPAPTSAEWGLVDAATIQRAFAYENVDEPDPAYVVVLGGRFTGNRAPTAGATPRGTLLFIVADPSSHDVTDWGLGNHEVSIPGLAPFSLTVANHASLVPGAHGLVVFAVQQSDDVQLFASNADGLDRRQLTSDATVKGPVAWSPDGSQIAFTTYDVSTWTERLEVMSADGTDRHILCERCTATFSVQRKQVCGIDSCSGPGAAAVPNRLEWSPDGRTIAAAPPQGTALALVDAANGHARSVEMPGTIDGVSWSPDGSRLAVTIGSNKPGLYVVGKASGSIESLLTADPYYAPPAWSPTGNTIAFPRVVKVNGDNMAELDLVDPSTGDARTVLGTDSLFEIYDLEWSPDGSRLAVLHHPVNPPTAALLTVNADGSHPTMVALCENGQDPDGLCTTNGGEVTWTGSDSLGFENYDSGRRGWLSLDLNTGDRAWLTDASDLLGCCIAGFSSDQGG